MIRLIATDLDGTLLNDAGEVSERTRAAVGEFVRRGGIFVPVTGRPGPIVPDWIRAWDAIQYFIYSNGARCVRKPDESTVFVRPMSSELALRALEILDPYPARRSLFANGQAWREEHDGPNAPSQLREMICRDRLEIEKIDATPREKNHRAQAWVKLEACRGLSISSAYDTNIEINATGGDKGSGVSQLAEILGIRRDEIMAFGDGLNDVSLLQSAGLPIAMENAVPELKEIAAYIAPEHDADGEAACIEKFALA